MRKYGVTVLEKGGAIPCALCLVFAHEIGSVPVNIMLTEY